MQKEASVAMRPQCMAACIAIGLQLALGLSAQNNEVISADRVVEEMPASPSTPNLRAGGDKFADMPGGKDAESGSSGAKSMSAEDEIAIATAAAGAVKEAAGSDEEAAKAAGKAASFYVFSSGGSALEAGEAAGVAVAHRRRLVEAFPEEVLQVPY